jgi:hypothetical protein
MHGNSDASKDWSDGIRRCRRVSLWAPVQHHPGTLARVRMPFSKMRASRARSSSALSTENIMPTAETHVQRFFVVHIMKTGGTSLLHQFHQNFAPEEVYPNRELDMDAERFLKHLRVDYLLSLSEERRRAIRVYMGHFPYVACELLGIDLVKLSLLREPIDRTVSLLQQLKRNGPRHKDSTLEQIYEHPNVFSRLTANHQTKVFATKADDDLVDYNNVIVVDADRLALAKRNLAQIDVLGLTEQYDEFLDELQSRFGWHFNRNVRANENVAIEGASPELRRRIAKDNEFDLELYDYARDLLRQR